VASRPHKESRSLPVNRDGLAGTVAPEELALGAFSLGASRFQPRVIGSTR